MIEGAGTLFPCDFYCTDPWQLGNIHDTDFKELEKNIKTAKFIQESKLLSTKCTKCEYYFICRGGCKRDREPDYTVNKYCEAYYNFFAYTMHRMILVANA